MLKETTKKPGSKKTSKKTAVKKTVTLYARVLGGREFDPEHAARLLLREKKLWRKEPFRNDPEPIAIKKENGTSKASGTEGAEGKQTGS